MRFVGSLDQGTSSTRFMIFDHNCEIVGQHQIEHRQIMERSGWVEHDAQEIWESTCEVISGALKSAGLEGSDLAAIGIANQRETTVMWDRETGLPLHNAIVWQDTRTADFLNSFSDETKEEIRHKTGLAVAPYFSAGKMHWLIENVSAVSASIVSGRAMTGTIDSWLLWKLSGGPSSGVHLTDVTNASRTSLMNIETLQWDQSLLDLFKVPLSILPEIRSSSEVYALTDPHGPFGAAVPIAGLLGDQQAALIGQTCFSKGESKTTYGTGNFALLNTGHEIVRSSQGLLTTVAYQFSGAPACYALEGSVAVTGSAVQWLRDQLGIITRASETEDLASSVENSGGVFFVPAFSGLFAPYWRSDARGVIVGLTRASTKAHIARATLEAICYQTREILNAMVADSAVNISIMRVDGGVTSNDFCMQLQADIMGLDVVRPKVSETTALGAAFAAGLAVGYWRNIEAIQELWQPANKWQPRTSVIERDEGLTNWKKAVARSLNWID